MKKLGVTFLALLVVGAVVPALPNYAVAAPANKAQAEKRFECRQKFLRATDIGHEAGRQARLCGAL